MSTLPRNELQRCLRSTHGCIARPELGSQFRLLHGLSSLALFSPFDVKSRLINLRIQHFSGSEVKSAAATALGMLSACHKPELSYTGIPWIGMTFELFCAGAQKHRNFRPLGAVTAVDSLADCLSDGQSHVRAAAARALGYNLGPLTISITNIPSATSAIYQKTPEIHNENALKMQIDAEGCICWLVWDFISILLRPNWRKAHSKRSVIFSVTLRDWKFGKGVSNGGDEPRGPAWPKA